MRKTIMFLIIISLSIFMFGCELPSFSFGKQPIPSNTGKVPTSDFSYNDYFDDGMILPQNNNFVIKGASEEGVLIKASLYDDTGYITKQSYAFANVDGEYSITLNTPKGSYSKYRLVLNDSIHEHVFNDVLFGDVIFFAGEQTIDKPVIEEEKVLSDENVEANDNIRFLKYLGEKLSWVDESEASLYCVAVEVAHKLQKIIQVPLAVIEATLPSVHADSWISKKSALNHKAVLSYLDYLDRSIDKDYEVLLNVDNVSSMYETYAYLLNELKASCMFWSQGKSDFVNVKDEDYTKIISTYCYLLSLIFPELTINNPKCFVYSIQEPFNDESYYNVLRYSQQAATFQLNNTYVIPTYDLFDKVEIEQELDEENSELEDEEVSEEPIYSYEFSFDKYVKRLTDFSYNTKYEGKKQYIPSSYSNVVANHEVITITFTLPLNEKIKVIQGLSVYDEFGEEIECNFDIDKNHLYLYLILEEEVDLNNYTIVYAQNEDSYICNLFSTNQMPVLPFIINIIE